MADEFPNATPRPWHLHGPFSVRICDGRHDSKEGCKTIVEAEIIGKERTEAVANTLLVHSAVNSYDALREAAEAARAWISRVSNQYILGADDPYEALGKLNAALNQSQQTKD